MRKKYKIIINIIIAMFTLALIPLSLCYFTKAMVPKWASMEEWEISKISQGFYDIPKNSVDVLVLGDSHVTAGVNCGMLTYEMGIPSVSVATAGQTMFSSCTWLKEALRFQRPSIIVLDVDMLFEEENFSDDTYYRKVFDYMKFSPVKLSALKEMAPSMSGLEASSYLFPMVRYHDRWPDLQDVDYSRLFASKSDANLGFIMFNSTCSEAPSGIDIGGLDDVVKPADSALIYFNEIVNVCQNNGLKLLLIKTPFAKWTSKQNACVSSLARDNGLDFIDYNEIGLMNNLGLNIPEMYSDVDHLNLFGAERLTKHLGSALSDLLTTISSNPVATRYFNELKPVYYYNLETKQLKFLDDNRQIIDTIIRNQSNYTIITVGCSESYSSTSDENRELLAQMGFDFDWDSIAGQGYGAISNCGRLIDAEHGIETINMKGFISYGPVYEIIVNGLEAGGYSRIYIDGDQYDFEEGGINLLVYDNVNKSLAATLTIY